MEYSSVKICSEEQPVLVKITSGDKPNISNVTIKKWQDIVDIISLTINVPSALIMRLKANYFSVFLRSNSTFNPYKIGENVKLHSGLYCETVVGTKNCLLVPNALKDPLWQKNPDIKLNMISYLGLPIMWPDGEIFGTICVLDNKENHYDNKCVKLLELLRNSIQKDLQLALDERMLEAKIKYIQATENKLRESEIKYRELFNNMRSAVIIYNVKNGGKNFIFEDLNKAAESIEKINKVDVIGKNFKKIFPKGLNTDLFKIMKHVWRTGVPKHLYPTFYKDYKMNIYRNNYYIYRLSAEEIVVVYDDISKSIEQQKTISEKEQIIYKTRELEKLRTEFFANISHELKTPLNIILGTIQLNKMIIENGENPINREKLINNINMEKQNCFRLLRLINNLIDSTEIDSKFIELNMVNCNIVNLVEEITQSVAKYINNNISITFDTDLEEKIIACDLDKVGRIILNLLSNSVKFTEPGGSIFVNIIDDKDYITITVKDTGIGIPQNKLNTIFDRFRQVDKSFTRKNEGSGIGLSIVKSLVEMHKGSIFVESKYGIGTKFTIKLPAKVLSNGNIEENRILNNTISNYDEKVRIEFSDIYKLNALSS